MRIRYNTGCGVDYVDDYEVASSRWDAEEAKE